MELKLDDKNEIMAFEVIHVQPSTISAEERHAAFAMEQLEFARLMLRNLNE